MAPRPAGLGEAMLALTAQAGAFFPSPSDGESERTAVNGTRFIKLEEQTFKKPNLPDLHWKHVMFLISVEAVIVFCSKTIAYYPSHTFLRSENEPYVFHKNILIQFSLVFMLSGKS